MSLEHLLDVATSYERTQSIMPVMLEKAEEGRKARFHQHLEAHLKEFWPDWERHHPSPYVADRGAKMETWCQNPQQPMEVL